LKKKIEIPGFRRGRAPRPILERFIGKDRLLDEALEQILPKITQQAMEAENITAFARPRVQITNKDPKLTFTARIPLPPKIQINDYKGIRVKPSKKKIHQKDVDAVLEQIRHQRATFESIKRPVALNDLVTIDIKGSVDGRDYLNREGINYPVRKDTTYPSPEFAKEIVGMKSGETKEFDIKFPSDHKDVEIAGKKVQFSVKLYDVKKEKLPDLDNKLVKQIDPQFETVEALRDQILNNLQLRADQNARLELENDIIEEVVKRSDVSYPPILTEIENERLVAQQVRQWQMTARSEDELKSLLQENPVEDLREKYRPVAEKRVIRSLVLGKIASDEGITVSDQDIDNYIDGALESVPLKNREVRRGEYNKEENRYDIHQTLLTRLTIDRLTEVATTEIRKTGKEKKVDSAEVTIAKQSARSKRKKEAKNE
jgi:trigger factor